MSRSIPALVQKFRDGKNLTPQEQEWVMAELERMAAEPIPTSLKDAGDDEVQDMHDVVDFTMPATVGKNAYTINGQPFFGPCKAEFHVYLALLRAHQEDILAYRELFESRGDVEGLKPFIAWIAPSIAYRVVQRTVRGTVETGHVGECLACVELKKGGVRAAA